MQCGSVRILNNFTREAISKIVFLFCFRFLSCLLYFGGDGGFLEYFVQEYFLIRIFKKNLILKNVTKCVNALQHKHHI